MAAVLAIGALAIPATQAAGPPDMHASTAIVAALLVIGAAVALATRRTRRLNHPRATA